MTVNKNEVPIMQIRALLRNPLFLIALFYFVTRLTNLLTLPIFNDEAIYIDWGAKEISSKWPLFYSLYDAKPPLLMWIFGLFHKFISDPLLAARIVSVLTGFATLAGIYKLSEIHFDRKTAIFASIIYTVIPLFAFFDRQALMESAISAVGIWSLILLLRLPEDKTVKNVTLLGLIWAIGIFIKQTALVFILAEIPIYWIIFKAKDRKNVLNLILSLIVFQVALLPLYFQEKFWTTLSENSRFTLSLGEIVSFPVSIWFKNLIGIFSISLWYLGPVILILALLGMWLSMSKNHNHKSIPLVFLFSLLIILISFKTINARYISAFLPLLAVFSAASINHFFQSRLYKSIILFVAILFPLILTTLLLSNPLDYFSFLGRLTPYSQEEGYVSGWTSGYATREAIEYLSSSSSEETPIIIAVRVDAGNPESAIFAYFNFSQRAKVTYFDSRFVDQNLFKYDCLTSTMTFYFVARDGNLAGMDKYLQREKTFYNPTRSNSVGIYKLKENCNGKTTNIVI